jgi:hypothetical protein
MTASVTGHDDEITVGLNIVYRKEHKTTTQNIASQKSGGKNKAVKKININY